MKRIIFCLLMLLCCYPLLSQGSEKGIPISIGLYAPYFIQPGLRVGSSVSLKSWKGDKASTSFTQAKTLFVNPQIGFFVRPGNHRNLLVSSDVGMKWHKAERPFYKAASIGLGYLNRFQIVSSTIDLSTGEVSGRNRERIDFFLPMANLELGHRPMKSIGWYTKLSYGRNMSAKIENASFFAIETGLNFRLR
jgi:hypothetical protein